MFKPLVSTNGIIDAIGNTPLLRIANLSDSIRRNIYAKAEFLNPGGSIKDRAAKYILQDAEKKGLLKSGGTVVEGTAGNTGIGLAHVCRAKGYKCVIYMPETQAISKLDILRSLGAEVHRVPVVPFSNQMNFNHQAKRHAELLSNAVWTDQFDNVVNKQAHYETTGPEIFAQLDGKVDGFTCSVGTGGTLSGVTRYLREKLGDKVKIVLTDPPGAAIYSYVKNKTLESSGSSFTEGIGQGRITNNLAGEIELLDDAYRIPDNESIAMLFEMIDTEGLFLGGTAALNLVGAVKLAKSLPEGSNVVTVLPDSGNKYSDRILNKEWLISKEIYDGVPEHLRKYIIH